jgi:DNA-binding YbaB/EbfC family protein
MSTSWAGGRLGASDLSGLLRQAEEQQRRSAEVQQRRAELRITGESPDGFVVVTVDGEMKVCNIEINARAMRLDSFTLAESIQAAIDVAYAAYVERNQELMAEALGDEDLVRQAREGTLKPEDWFRRFGVDLGGVVDRLRR